MVEIMDLWLPILLAAVLVFVFSSLVHMVFKYHASDYKGLPNEDSVLEGLRANGVQPGHYVFPYCADMKEMANPEMIAKYEHGPVGFATVFPNGPMPMGKSLLQWFIFSVVIGIFTAYVATFTLQAGADYMVVFRLTGTVAFLGYAGCAPTESIWKGLSWGTTCKFLFDGLVYGLLTGGAFGWLWPGLVG